MKIIGLLLLLLVIIAGITIFLHSERGIAGEKLLTEDPSMSSVSGFSYADSPREFIFPEDHGPHADFQTEWWYYTGNLVDPGMNEYGYQLTFFRRGLIAPINRKLRESSWASYDIMMGHFALSQIAEGRFDHFERFSRFGMDLAGATGTPLYRVWLENWGVVQDGDNLYHLKARQDGIEIDLELEDTKGPVLQGIDGLSPKGESLGNASYYYSKPRLKSDGLIMLDGEQIPVTGWSWMDHEFSTSVLAQDTVGWDWYAIQLDDGSELMIFILNKDDGGIDDYSSGAIIYPDGSTKRLLINDFQVRSVGEWYSDLSSTKYPSGWNIQVPSEAINILVTPKLVDQELNLSFVYWEGAVSVTGTQSGRSVSGQGYVELTGYAHTMRGRF